METAPAAEQDHSVRYAAAIIYLDVVKQLMTNLPETAEELPSYEDYNYFEKLPVLRDGRGIAFTRFSDGVMAEYSTAEFLEDRAHQYFIPFTGDAVHYQRRTFNVDAQKIGSKALDLKDFEQICAEDSAFFEFITLLAEIREHKIFEKWQQEKQYYYLYAPDQNKLAGKRNGVQTIHEQILERHAKLRR